MGRAIEVENKIDILVRDISSLKERMDLLDETVSSIFSKLKGNKDEGKKKKSNKKGNSSSDGRSDKWYGEI